MRKVTATILIGTMTLSLTACGGTNHKNTSTSTSNATVQSTPSAEDKSATAEDPLGFHVFFSDTYRNDKTGNWRLAEITENINIEEYAVDYYKNYFKDDNEVHIIVNFTRNTTTNITNMGGALDVTTMDYVDGEEHDAALACSGTLLAEYHVDIESGEITKVQ